MNPLHHVTLTTGHLSLSNRSSTSDGVIQKLSPWLGDALSHGGTYPLPSPLGDAGYKAALSVVHGALLCTLCFGAKEHLLTFGVAVDGCQAGEFWALLCANHGSVEALKAPALPWCAVALHPALNDHLDAAKWAGDFERCLAWTWIERNK